MYLVTVNKCILHNNNNLFNLQSSILLCKWYIFDPYFIYLYIKLSYISNRKLGLINPTKMTKQY